MAMATSETTQACRAPLSTADTKAAPPSSQPAAATNTNTAGAKATNAPKTHATSPGAKQFSTEHTGNAKSNTQSAQAKPTSPTTSARSCWVVPNTTPTTDKPPANAATTANHPSKGMRHKDIGRQGSDRDDARGVGEGYPYPRLSTVGAADLELYGSPDF